MNLSINQLIQDITDKYVSITDNVLTILYNKDIARAKRIFRKVFELAVKRYDEYCPLVRQVRAEGSLKLVSNFDEYLKGNISESELVLEPIALANMNEGSIWATKNLWSWNEITGEITGATGIITYYARHPFVYKDGDNSSWDLSEDSVIYFIDDLEAFENRLAFELLSHITRNRNLIQLPTGVPMLDFTAPLQDLTLAIESDEKYSTEMYDMWSHMNTYQTDINKRGRHNFYS